MPENDAKQVSIQQLKVKLVDMRQTWFRLGDAQAVNLEEALPSEFDAFITQYLDIEDVDRTEWPLIQRWRAVNFAVKNGQFLEFCETPETASQAV